MIHDNLRRRPDGKFKSHLEIEEEAWNKEIKAKMDAGMSFDEAWVAAGGEIIPTNLSTPECVEEIRAAYASAGRSPPAVRRPIGERAT